MFGRYRVLSSVKRYAGQRPAAAIDDWILSCALQPHSTPTPAAAGRHESKESPDFFRGPNQTNRAGK